MLSDLRRKLEDKAGSSECEILIPYFLLPPRFYKLANDRNMVLLLDHDVVVHARWEGPEPDPHIPLSPKAASRLLKDVGNKISQYKKDLQTVSRFIESRAEQPFWDPRLDSLTAPREERPAPNPREEETEIIAVLHRGELVQGTVEELTTELGELDFKW